MLELKLETELIAALLNFSDNKPDPSLIEAISKVQESDFTDEHYRLGIIAIKQLWEQGEKVNKTTIMEKMLHDYKDKAMESYVYMLGTTRGIFFPRDAQETFLKLRELTVLRAIKEMSMIRAQRLGNVYDPFEEISLQNKENESLQMMLSSIRNTGTLEDIMNEVRDEYYKKKQKAESGQSANEYPLHLDKFDTHMMFERGDLIILAARPGMGKTAFSLFIARSMCMQGKRVLIVSLEMTGHKLAGRILCGHSQISSERYRLGKLYQEETTKMNNGIEQIKQWELIIRDDAPMTTSEIMGIAMIEAQRGLDMIIVDYLGLIQIPNRGSRNDELGVVSQSLKQLAKRVNVPVIALHQLSRKVEERSIKKPLLSDLRDSGNIEQDADIVLFLYRDDYYNTKPTPTNEIEVIISKYREGEANKYITLQHNDQLTNFSTETTF